MLSASALLEHLLGDGSDGVKVALMKSHGFPARLLQQAAQQFWPDDLFALVEKSRRKNAERDITGMLLFHEGNFLQLLEVPENAVRGCFNIIERDPRHAAVQVLLTQTRDDRDFPDWTMGFERVDEAWNVPRAWATILEKGLTARTSSAAHDLLLSFHNVAEQCAAKGGSPP